jgi:hypothetical protein
MAGDEFLDRPCGGKRRPETLDDAVEQTDAGRTLDERGKRPEPVDPPLAASWGKPSTMFANYRRGLSSIRCRPFLAERCQTIQRRNYVALNP